MNNILKNRQLYLTIVKKGNFFILYHNLPNASARDSFDNFYFSNAMWYIAKTAIDNLIVPFNLSIYYIELTFQNYFHAKASQICVLREIHLKNSICNEENISAEWKTKLCLNIYLVDLFFYTVYEKYCYKTWGSEIILIEN